ncbi:MAG TPA: zf-HC2 domain-containing protein [Candidatus Binatia bacterium]|nr:zf-HC2 domain-containing protein [Candidatus Binatia bacterium]
MNCEAYQDLVAAHVDGELGPAERQEVEQHLTSCASCQRLFAEESRFRAAFAARRLIVPLPVEAERRLRLALAAESAPIPSWRERLSALLWQPRLAFGLAATALIIALLLPRLFPPAPEPAWFTRALDSYHAATEGRLSFTYRTADPQELEAAFNRSGQLDFVTHVLDLRSAGYRIAGGQVVRENDHPVAVVLYQGEDGPIVCIRQRGTTPPMPPGSEGVSGQYLYTRAGYTVSCVQSAEHFCTLITRLPREVLMRRLALMPAS